MKGVLAGTGPGLGKGGGRENGDGGLLQRLHVALPHYAAFRRRAALRQRGLGSPQTSSGATIPGMDGCKGRPCHAIIPQLLTSASYAFDIISLLKS